MRHHRIRYSVIVGITAVAAGSLAAATPADAATTSTSHAAASQRSARCLMGQTSVTTAPGIALTLIRSGVLPLPVLPRTGFGLSFSHGSLAATYRFPITGGDPDLAGPSGDIHHDGGIYFAGRRSHLEIGRFDIDLSAGKIFADQVDFRGAHLPVLDLDLSGLKVDQHEGRTVLSGIGLKLDPAAANALNSTFDLGLPTDGSLLFGTGQVTLKSGPCNTWPR